jgi:hypothetical protein
MVFSAWATQVNLVADPDNWFTPQPHDTLFINEPGKYMIKITQIGKYHIEQTIKDTVEFRLQADNLIDEKVRNGLPSTDTLQVSLKNLHAGRRVKRGDDYLLNFIKDTCNISIALYGDCRLTDISSVGYRPSYIYVSGSSPTFKCFVYDSFTCARRINSAQIYGIETRLSNADSLHYYFNPLGKLSTGGVYNNEGHIIFNDSKIIENMVISGTGTSTTLKNCYFEANDYTWHNSILACKGKLYIENSTLESTNDLTLLNSADTLFINQSAGKTTRINATIGSKRNPLSETKYSRVVVNNASYIREITAMANIYNGNIDILCPSPQVKDTLTNADVNVYGGKIGQITNVVHYGPTGSFLVNYKNRIINVYGGTIGGNNTYSNTAIHCGFYQFSACTTKDLYLNDTINLYNGKISIPKDYHLINFTDNTVINIYHNKSNNKRTQFKYHPSNDNAKGEYFNYIALISDNIVGDSIHWTIGDMRHLSGIKSISTAKPWPGSTRKPFRIVYRNSQQPNDSLVYGVSKDSTHYFGRLLDTYDVVDIYPSFKRRITYVHTLDETWTSKDTTYYEGFGKSSLPKVIYAGKTFRGWFTQPEGGLKVDSISHLQMGDVTLYTQWGPGQDIIYSDFDHNRLCNTGAVEIKYGKDLNNLIESGIKPLEGHNTKAMHCNVIQNEGYAKTILYLRNSYLDNQDIYKNAPRVYMDLRSTTGISMKHKGMSVRVNVDNCYYVIPQHEELTLVNIPWEQFTLSGNRRDLENVSEIRFQPIAEQGEYWIDDIIFTKGDIYPLESIKLDTVPNKYLYTKNPDLLDIPLPIKADSTQLYLYPKFTPSDATYQAINWSSKDPSIATVDDYGRVNGISHGQTYIYCQSVMHPEVKDSILVGVQEGGLTYNLNGVRIGNDLPVTYDYSHPQAIPVPQPINDFYTFHGWHTDSITGAVVDSASFHQFGNLKAHTLYAEFTRAVPGAAITVMQNRILAVQNPYNYDALKEAHYQWTHNNVTLPSEKMFVEVGRPIPVGTYQVTIQIDDEMPIYLNRTLDNSINQHADANTNLSLYPNPVKAGNLVYLIGKFDAITLYDLNGQAINTPISNEGIFRAPYQTGMYLLEIRVENQVYSIKLIVI